MENNHIIILINDASGNNLDFIKEEVKRLLDSGFKVNVSVGSSILIELLKDAQKLSTIESLLTKH